MANAKLLPTDLLIFSVFSFNITGQVFPLELSLHSITKGLPSLWPRNNTVCAYSTSYRIEDSGEQCLFITFYLSSKDSAAIIDGLF